MKKIICILGIVIIIFCGCQTKIEGDLLMNVMLIGDGYKYSFDIYSSDQMKVISRAYKDKYEIGKSGIVNIPNELMNEIKAYINGPREEIDGYALGLNIVDVQIKIGDKVDTYTYGYYNKFDKIVDELIKYAPFKFVWDNGPIQGTSSA